MYVCECVCVCMCVSMCMCVSVCMCVHVQTSTSYSLHRLYGYPETVESKALES